MKIYNDVFEALESLGIHFTKEEKAYMKALAQIGGQLMAYRKKHNLTQTALAEKIGVSQAMISAIERGDKNVSIKVLAKIVAKLGGNLRIDLGILRQEDTRKTEWTDVGFENFRIESGEVKNVEELAGSVAA